MGTGQRTGAIIRAVNEHRPQELSARIGLAGTKAHLGGLDHGIITIYPDRGVEGILFRHDQRGDKLLGAGDLS